MHSEAEKAARLSALRLVRSTALTWLKVAELSNLSMPEE